MSDTTPRLGLTTIRPGQAQKELSHNEALALIDLLTQATVQQVALNAPPATPSIGEAWIVGAAPTDAWTGKAQHLAGWSEGGWRFVAPTEGMSVWVAEALVSARFSGGAWAVGELRATRVMIGGQQVLGSRGPAIAAPSGGSMIDVEARAALASLLAAARAHGLIAS